MKAVILNAGCGSRLLPLTLHVPKCLISVAGEEILRSQLTALSQAGISEAVVVVGYRHQQVEEFLAQDLPLPASVVFNPFWSVSNSIGSLWAARAHLAEPFCVLNGDTLFEPAVLRQALQAPPPGIGLLVEPVSQPALDDMRVEVEDGRVVSVAKDLDPARTTHRSLGVVTSSGHDGLYLRALDAVIRRDGGYNVYHHAVIDALAGEDQVSAIVRPPGRWQEIDRVEDMEAWGAEAGRATP